MNRIAFILIVFLAACSVSKVDRYPGKSIATFPEKYQGEYRLSIGGFRGFFQSKQLDSARVRILSDHTESLNDKGWQVDFKIDSASVLSQLDQYYFISKKDATEPDFWNTTLWWATDKDLYLFPINETDKNLSQDKLKNYLTLQLLIRTKQQTQIKTIGSQDKVMLKTASNISPDSKDSILYYQMNDAQLLRFIKKEVSAKNALRFTRIKQTISAK